MGSLRHVGGALLAAVVLATPLVARAQDNRETLPPGQVRALVEKYAACVVRYRADQVRAALRGWQPGENEPALPLLQDCAANAPYSTTEMSFPRAAYRYAMAEALYVADHRDGAPASYDAVPLATPPALTGVAEEAAAERFRLIVGDCVVRTAPAAVHALLTSAVETRAETAALIAVQPLVAQCLPKGQTARFNKSSLRGVLALAALRLNDAASPAHNSSGGTH